MLVLIFCACCSTLFILQAPFEVTKSRENARVANKFHSNQQAGGERDRDWQWSARVSYEVPREIYD